MNPLAIITEALQTVDCYEDDLETEANNILTQLELHGYFVVKPKRHPPTIETEFTRIEN